MAYTTSSTIFLNSSFAASAFSDSLSQKLVPRCSDELDFSATSTFLFHHINLHGWLAHPNRSHITLIALTCSKIFDFLATSLLRALSISQRTEHGAARIDRTPSHAFARIYVRSKLIAACRGPPMSSTSQPYLSCSPSPQQRTWVASIPQMAQQLYHQPIELSSLTAPRYSEGFYNPLVSNPYVSSTRSIQSDHRC